MRERERGREGARLYLGLFQKTDSRILVALSARKEAPCLDTAVSRTYELSVVHQYPTVLIKCSQLITTAARNMLSPPDP